jgi:hypothetical protein
VSRQSSLGNITSDVWVGGGVTEREGFGFSDGGVVRTGAAVGVVVGFVVEVRDDLSTLS